MAVAASVAVGEGEGEGGPSDCTKIGLLVPLMDGSLVSVAVIVWYPSVLSVGMKMAVPLGNGESGGSNAKGSVLVKCTVPGYPVAVVLS